MRSQNQAFPITALDSAEVHSRQTAGSRRISAASLNMFVHIRRLTEAPAVKFVAASSGAALINVSTAVLFNHSGADKMIAWLF